MSARVVLPAKRGIATRVARYGVIAVVVTASSALAAGVPAVYGGGASAATATVSVTGVAPNNSSAKIYYQPVAGARDYRVYEAGNPGDVKYAGQVHLIPTQACPGAYCLSHFIVQADGTPIFPYQVADGPTGGPQVLDVPSTEIEWNGLGDGQPHTLIVEAVDQLGPVPQGSLYTGNENVPAVSPLPAGAMLGSNKGHTADGKLSTNGQGPYTDNPLALAASQPFVVQADLNAKPVPSGADASQAFLDTFENAEGATIKQLARNDNTRDSFNNLGSATYSMNANTSRAWTIESRQADNINSMPFIASNHFMDMLFDGATPNTSAPTHTIYGSMSLTPTQTLDMSGGQVLHMTMEVDAHQSFRRWVDFNLAPASDPLQSWGGSGGAINNTNLGVFLELKGSGCTLDIYTGPTAGSTAPPTGTAGGSDHGARLWGQAGSVGGAPVMCYAPYNPTSNSDNGLGLDDRSRLDFFISQTHAALFEDGQLVVQSDIPAGSFPWANVPLKAYYSHYLYHSDADIVDLETVQNAGSGWCYPLNSFWFNDPLAGTAPGQTFCNTNYPAGYGFPHSDERHWDNMGFEVLSPSAASAADYSILGSRVQPPSAKAPHFVNGSPATATPTSSTVPPTATGTATAHPPTATSVAATSVPTPVSGQTGQWVNVTPRNVDLFNTLDCGNYGTSSVVADPTRPSNLYAQFYCQGIWKSTDFGQTWTGPINTGPGGAAAGDAAGGLAIAAGQGTNPPLLYSAGIRGSGTGFWRSLDGGVSWTNFNIGPAGNRQDVYPPVVDPYDSSHLLLDAHEQDALYQSSDGGMSWMSVPLAGGMASGGGTSFTFFVDTGNAASTRGTWLYTAQGTGGVVGTWRTSNGGASWTRVDRNEHPHGAMQNYQPDSNGVVYMAGVYSDLGWGVLRSADYGQSWTHVGATGSESTVFGTPNNVYADYGIGGNGPSKESAPQPSATGWTSTAAPAGMSTGAASSASVFDGAHHIIVTANWQAGLWQYVEPNSGSATSIPTPTLATTPTPTRTATPSPTATIVVTPSVTPSVTPTLSPGGFTTGVAVRMGNVARPASVWIPVSITSAGAATVVVDLEVYDPNGVKVFQKYWDGKAFTAGQTAKLSGIESVPVTSAAGKYTVKIGIFSLGWKTLYNWNDSAATFMVK